MKCQLVYCLLTSFLVWTAFHFQLWLYFFENYYFTTLFIYMCHKCHVIKIYNLYFNYFFNQNSNAINFNKNRQYFHDLTGQCIKVWPILWYQSVATDKFNNLEWHLHLRSSALFQKQNIKHDYPWRCLIGVVVKVNKFCNLYIVVINKVVLTMWIASQSMQFLQYRLLTFKNVI